MLFKFFKKEDRVITAAKAYVRARRDMKEYKRLDKEFTGFEDLCRKADLAFDELVASVDTLL